MNAYYQKKYQKNIYITNFSKEPILKKSLKETNYDISQQNYKRFLKKYDEEDYENQPTFNTSKLFHPMDYQKLKEYKKQIYQKFGIKK